MKVSAYIPLAVLALGLSGCSDQPRDKSTESELLRTTVVPQILTWAHSESEELKLGDLPALRAFDYVCYVWEYQAYDKIEEAIGPIKSYFGAYLSMVPENKIAFVGVVDQSAHVAHVQPDELNIVGERCVPRNRARLVKSANTPDLPSQITLEVSDAGSSNSQ